MFLVVMQASASDHSETRRDGFVDHEHAHCCSGRASRGPSGKDNERLVGEEEQDKAHLAATLLHVFTSHTND